MHCVYTCLLKIPHSNFIFKKKKPFNNVQSPATCRYFILFTRFDVTVNMRKHDMYLYFLIMLYLYTHLFRKLLNSKTGSELGQCGEYRLRS